MRSRKARQPTQRELRGAMGAGLIVTRYASEGERATVQQLAPESFDRKRDFIRRLTDESKPSEGSV